MQCTADKIVTDVNINLNLQRIGLKADIPIVVLKFNYVL